MRRKCLLWCFLLFFAVGLAYGDGAPAFDLDGPTIDAKVMRQDQTLPISEVASLAPGDRLWVHPDLPNKEGAHYILVIAFLRGSVNPPPENWFTKAETWNKKIREEGIYVTVPDGAQQVLLFLAPETGGDYSTLRNAVRGRPGAFVRASQDLYQASLDRARLDTYLAAVKSGSADDPAQVKEHATLLARSLNVKVDSQCFDKPTEQQAPCLVQNPDALVLDNGRSMTAVQALTSGAAGDMLSQMSYTQQAGDGFYSVYVGTVIDMARILDSFRTAQYQYFPALAIPQGDTLHLKLNNPPSFHKPQSVLVVGLPAAHARALDTPVLQAVDPKSTLCAQKKPLVLEVDGAPYVFATRYAHDFALRVKNKSGQDIDIPASPDPSLGGFILSEKDLEAQNLPAETTGRLHGYWGFEPIEGPIFHLVSAHAEQWTLAPDDEHALIVGRKNTIHLKSAAVACVDGVAVSGAGEEKLDSPWKAMKANELEVEVPLEKAKVGTVNLLVKQTGLEKPDQVSLHTYSQAGRLDDFQLHAGDHQGVLKGTRLDEVASMTINGVIFSPAAALTHTGSEDSLVLSAPSSFSSTFRQGEGLVAKVALKDGRILDLNSTVQTPRPKVKLMNEKVSSDAVASAVQLGSKDELPDNAKLVFFIQAVTPAAFPRNETIEVASNDNSFSTVLKVGKGGIVLQDGTTALVRLDPEKAFGGSAFGPLRFRPISSDGVEGDWQPLATLVRVPELKELKCANGASVCTLVGTDLYLLDQVGADAQMVNAVTVPEGFGDTSLNVPHSTGTLYFKLRDDPTVVNTAVLPVTPEPGQSASIAPAPIPAAPAPSQQAAAQTTPKPAPQPAPQATPTTAPQASPQDAAPVANPSAAPAASASQASSSSTSSPAQSATH